MSGGYTGFPMREALRLTRQREETMSKLFEVRECEHGVEIKVAKDHCCGGSSYIQELLTVEEAESLAQELLNAAQDVRRKKDELSRE